ncbi:hypothetical protein Tco_1236402 [Tanacetum coccineum]
MQIVGEPDCLMIKCVFDQNVNYLIKNVLPLGKPCERYNVISKLAEHIVHTSLKKRIASDIFRKGRTYGRQEKYEMLKTWVTQLFQKESSLESEIDLADGKTHNLRSLCQQWKKLPTIHAQHLHINTRKQIPVRYQLKYSTSKAKDTSSRSIATPPQEKDHVTLRLMTSLTDPQPIHNIDQDIQQAEHEYDESRVVAELRLELLKRRKWRNGAVFIGRKTQRSLGAVLAVPDISGGRPVDYALVFVFLWGMLYLKTCNNDKNLSEIQLEHEKEDELVAVVVKVVHELNCMMVVNEIENKLFEKVEKLEWWFEQNIDDEGGEDEEDGGGDEV